jgi:hypothetical protein
MPPSRPHAKSAVPPWHDPNAQQPRHDVASHTHCPPEHRVPAGHGENRFPHEQFPNWHESAVFMSHVAQFWPFGPHAVTVRFVMHTPF